MLNWIGWFFFHPGSSSCTPGWSRTHRSAPLCVRSAGTKRQAPPPEWAESFPFWNLMLVKSFLVRTTPCCRVWQYFLRWTMNSDVHDSFPASDSTWFGCLLPLWSTGTLLNSMSHGSNRTGVSNETLIQWKFLTSSHPGKRWSPDRFPSTSGRQSMSLRHISYSLEFRALRQNFSLHFLKQKPQIKGK